MSKYELEYTAYREQLEADASLYESKRAYVIQMRFSMIKSSVYYNLVKNELMSYRGPNGEIPTYRLTPSSEKFLLSDTVVAQMETSSGQLNFYIKLNPAAYSTSDAIHKDVSGIEKYKNTPLKIVINKENRLNKTLSLIGDLMENEGYIKQEEYEAIDYASFFSKEKIVVIRTEEEIDVVNEEDILPDDIITFADIVEPEEQEQEEVVYEEEINLDSRPVFDEYQSVEYYTLDKKTIFEEEKPQQLQKNKKKNLWQELSDYGYSFMPLKKLLFFTVVILSCIAIGIIYKLDWIFIGILTIFGLLLTPSTIKAFYRNKFEQRRGKDAETYIEQMLYSFRRNSKIINSLEDALMVFPNGNMHDLIIEALNIIRDSQTTGNAYEKALKIIEDSYPCRRIQALHRYMIKVEDIGGKHEMGIQALLKDRRQWIDRTNMFRKKCSTIVKEIIISAIFSLGMGLMMLYMLPSDMYDISQSIVYQIVTVIFIAINLFTVKATFSATVIYLQDEDKEKTERTIRLLRLLKNYDVKKERIKYLKQSAIFLILVPVGIIAKMHWIAILGGLLALFTAFVKRHIDYRSARKRAIREIEKVYPDWLLELALLLQSDNVHVAISKTIDSAHPILKDELIQLTDNLRKHPVELTPYISFFDYLPIENVQSSMKLLYSIRIFGASDESVQIGELVERNHLLMTKAEEMRNEDKLSKIFITKFLPMLASSIKMVVDLMLFMLFFLSLMNGIL